MRTISISNQKGGCGKTTTAVNISAAFAMLGHRVLLIDLDPQAHATLGVGCDADNVERTVYHVLMNEQIGMTEVITGTSTERLDLVPSNVLLAGAELELVSFFAREFVLNDKLKKINEQYDYCVIDCPPSLGLLTLNALVASSEVIIPVQTHYYAIEGLKQLLGTIDVIKERLNQELKILGVVLTFVEERTILSRQVQQQMREFFGEMVFDTVIHKTVRLAEAPSAGKPIMSFAPESGGAAEYTSLAQEIINGKVLVEDVRDGGGWSEEIGNAET